MKWPLKRIPKALETLYSGQITSSQFIKPNYPMILHRRSNTVSLIRYLRIGCREKLSPNFFSSILAIPLLACPSFFFFFVLSTLYILFSFNITSLDLLFLLYFV